MRVRYAALTRDGRAVSGVLEVASPGAAIAQLQLQGLLPIEASETVPAAAARRGALPARSLILFARQMARLTQAGMPFDRALHIVLGLMRDRASREAVAAVLAELSDGASLSDAMARQGGAFPSAVIAMARAGEQGGVLPSVLARAADFLEKTEKLRQAVISALIYPAILALVASLAIVLILAVVIPEFQPLFKEAGARLPLLTRLVMAAAAALRDGWWMLPPAALLAAWGMPRLLRRPAVARRLARAVLRVPVLGQLGLKQDAARFARTLAALLGNGVASERALALAGGVVQNPLVAEAVARAAEQVRRGEGFAAPLLQAALLPPVLSQLTRVGEETGRLPELLTEAAGLLEEDAERTVSRLVALLVPALTVVMGGVIATIVASVLLAMLSLNDLAS